GELDFERLETPTCAAIAAFLDRTQLLVARALDGHNAEAFATELAINIRALLLDHFKKFTINASGGLMVTKDVSKYVATLKNLPISASVASSLEVLGEVGNLFVIGPDALRESARGGALAGLEKTEIRKFIERREDDG